MFGDKDAMLGRGSEIVTLDEIKRDFLQKTYFGSACAPSPFHWHFQQAYEALIAGLYLPGVSGLLNGIEASLRTTVATLEGCSLDGDLGAVMSNSLLRRAEQRGLKVGLLAFPEEADFRGKLKTGVGVELVQLRNDICHGNFQRFVWKMDGSRVFTPECVGKVSAQLLQISFDWTRSLCDFYYLMGWRSSGAETLIVPNNPLRHWLTI